MYAAHHRAPRAARPTLRPFPLSQWEHIDISAPLTHDNFVGTLTRYPIVIVNFFAPW